MELNAAAGEFEDESIDLLHIARTSSEVDSSPLDLTTWKPKLRLGGVIVITSSAESAADDFGRKLWRGLSESFPSVLVDTSHLLGIAQIPSDEGTPLIALLEQQFSHLRTLFRVLGERVDYRHVIGAEPVSAHGLRLYISELLTEHADVFRRIEAQHQSEIDATNQKVASLSEQLLASAYEISERKTEADTLLATLSRYAADYERERNAFHTQLSELHHRHGADLDTLRHEINLRDIKIQAIISTVSWQVTKPLRVIQRLLIRLGLAPGHHKRR
jgi:hypothetical protein